MDMRPPLPKEHGAWAQVAITVGAVMILARAHPPGFWAWVGALGLAFIAHESMLLLLGQRGAKARKEQGRAAWIWMLLLVGFATCLGWTGGVSASAEARRAALLPAAFAVLLLPGTVRGEEKSLAGEVLAALALGSAALPLALRAGVVWMPAWRLAAGLMAAFLLATLFVRRTLAMIRKRPEPLSAVGATFLMVVGAAMGGVLMGTGHPLGGVACLPLPVFGLRLFVKPWPPHRLKRLGWMLAIATIVTALLLAVALR